MPVAAAPSYLPGKLFAEASPASRFGPYLSLWDASFGIRPADKRSALDAACILNAADKARLRALAQRQRRLAEPFEQSGAALVFDAVAVAPFTTGLGNEHPLENGFAFLNPYGLPYLPGSGVKGVVRRAADELASGDWGDTGGWNHDESYPLKIGDKTIDLSLTDVLFGRETLPGEREHVRGALAFWDVFPQIEGDRLVVEAMTAHQSDYYQHGATPHDSGSPNPINFLTVPPKSRFAFYVICDLAHLRRLAVPLAQSGRWEELVGAAFRHAFEWLGFGAKTAVGYGALTTEAKAAAEHPTAAPATRRAPPATTNEEVWERARLHFSAQNGRLTATGPQNRTAYADAPRGAELFAGLPEDVQRQVRSNPRSVQVVATVRGSELTAVRARS